MRAIGDSGTSEPSEVVTGHRNYTEDNLYIQWERATHSSFNDVVAPEGLEGFQTYDEDAPADGSTVYYRARFTDDGELDHVSDHRTGFVAHDCVDDLDFRGRPGDLTTTRQLDEVSGINDLWSETNSMHIGEGASRTLNPSISIENATVTEIRRFPESDFMLGDRSSGIRVRLDDDLPEDVEVGQQVSMEVLEVRAFSDFVYISKVDGFTVESSNNPVRVIDASMHEFNDLRFLRDRIVRLFGRITEEIGSCGNSTCYTMEIGPSDAIQEIRFRSTSNLISEGQCITFVGPLSLYPGPRQYVPTAERQIELDSFDWFWTHFLDD